MICLGSIYVKADTSKDRSILRTYFCNRPEGSKCDSLERCGKCCGGNYWGKYCPYLEVRVEETTTRQSMSFAVKDAYLRKKHEENSHFDNCISSSLGVCGEQIHFPYRYLVTRSNENDLRAKEYLPLHKFTVDWLQKTTYPYGLSDIGKKQYRLLLFHLEHMFPNLFLEYVLTTNRDDIPVSPDEFENVSVPVKLLGPESVGCKVRGKNIEVIGYEDGVLVVRGPKEMLCSSMTAGEVVARFVPDDDLMLTIMDMELQRKVIVKYPWCVAKSNFRKQVG